MEPDRFKRNEKLFILGMICLVLSLGLIFFSLYILPYLIWELNYNIPEFLLSLLTLFQEDYNYSVGASKFVVWLLFFVPGLIAGFIAYFVSNDIDNQIYEVKTNSNEIEKLNKETKERMKESAGIGLKIFGLMVIFVVIIFLLQFIISST